MRPDGASLVLVTFAGTKVARLPGRTPASIWLHLIWDTKRGMNLEIAYSPSRTLMNTESDVVAFSCFGQQ